MSSSTAKSRFDVFSDFFAYKMLDVHTQVPAVITSVSGRSVDCQPLVKTRYTDGRQLGYDVLYDVPLLVLSANKGKTAIKMPVKAGDIVLVFFSEREFGGIDGLTDSASDSGSLQTHGLYPVGAFPCIFSSAVGEDIDPDNIVIQNESSSIVVEPNGKIIATTTSEYEVNASKAVFNCDIEINGNTTHSGDVSVGGTITNDGVNIGKTHTHGGVQAGGDNTGVVN